MPETLTRGEFLAKAGMMTGGAIAAGLVLAACRPWPEAETERFHLPQGEWSKEQAIELAQSMLAETQFNDVSFAGKILKANQEGQPSFSTISDLFVDDPVKLITFPDFKPYPNILSPAGFKKDNVGDKVNVVLKAKNQGEADIIFEDFTAYKASEIVFNDKLLKNNSPLATEFIVAKEVLNVRAFQMLADFSFYSMAWTHQIPNDGNLIKALKINALRQDLVVGINHLPMPFAGDFFAHYLMVPNYLKAKEQGRFNKWDMGNLGTFQLAADYFKKAGILSKDKNGNYQWTSDGRLFPVWGDATVGFYKQFNYNPS